MDKYFRKYAQYLNTVQRRVKIIKPWKARAGIEVIASQLREIRNETISNQWLYYSASSDIWTSRSKLAFICFTLPYQDKMFCMQSWVLEVKHLPGKHDGFRIADSLRDIMTEWGLPIEKCVKFLRDEAPNGVKACEILNNDSISCLAHSLRLVVGSGVVKKKVDKSSKEIISAAKTDEDVGAAIVQVVCEGIDAFIDESCESSRADLQRLRGSADIFHRLAVYFSRFPKALDCLKSLQPRALNPQTDCATRWNSTHAMLLRMIELRITLDEFFGHIARTREFSDRKLEQPTAEHWFTIRCVTESSTDGLGREKYSTPVIAVPVLRSIERKIKSAKMFEAITRSVGNEVFVPRVEALIRSLPGEPLWISVLDPRSAELKHLSDEETKTAISGFKLAVFDMGKEIKSNRYSSHESTRVENESAVQLTTINQNVAWLTEVFSGGIKMYAEREPTVADGKFEDECDSQVRHYLGDAHGTPVTTDALKWWSRRRGKEPFVESLARKWLGCIATSVPSERAFSKSGNVVTQSTARSP
ncbi:Zinc finger BED domain containing hypothetical protein 1-like [Phytophthora palmivora]|uniref:HAT C-terminal dimerisation domain-containing protein n=1 Tax=Phytophthora palmivora TaxID=4796 RepID=A0A2P4XV64_9STRA|nr:Zinc finger BED domain containing hypothetical protein 1-like [Phytophthora palmivora]